MFLGNAISNTLYKMDIISEKHKAISSNLANMDTPNYRKKDISFSQLLGGSSGSLETALSIKMGPCPISNQSLDGKVDPTRELAEMRKNVVFYTEATRRMTSIISEMKQAVSMGS